MHRKRGQPRCGPVSRGGAAGARRRRRSPADPRLRSRGTFPPGLGLPPLENNVVPAAGPPSHVVTHEGGIPCASLPCRSVQRCFSWSVSVRRPSHNRIRQRLPAVRRGRGTAAGDRGAPHRIRRASRRSRGAARRGRGRLGTDAGGHSGPPAAPPEAPPPAGPAEPPRVPAGAAGAGGPRRAARLRGAARASKVFNPDIAAIGDFLGAAGKTPGGGEPSLDMHESEVAFQAVVDPYARADFFLSFGPRRRGARGGLHHVPDAARRLADEGRQDARRVRQGQHAAHHVLPWTDRPLVTQQPRGRRGRHRRRGHLGRAPDPEPVAVPRGDRPGLPRRLGETSSSAPTRGDSATSATCAAYQRPHASPPTSISAARIAYGHNARHRRRRQPSRRRSSASTRRCAGGRCGASIYTSFIGRTRADLEPAASSRTAAQTRVRRSTAPASTSSRAAGSPARATTAPSAPTTPSLRDKGGSFILTYWPSEFSQVRGQYRRTRYARRAARPTSCCSSSSSRSAPTAPIRSRSSVRQMRGTS